MSKSYRIVPNKKPCPRGHKNGRVHTLSRRCYDCHLEDSTAYKKRRRTVQRLENPTFVLWENAKKRAISTNIVFTIEVDDIVLPEVCPCCKKPFVFGAPLIRAVPQSPSLDRRVPEQGYIPGNVNVICTRCNVIKRDGTLEELEGIVRWMRG